MCFFVSLHRQHFELFKFHFPSYLPTQACVVLHTALCAEYEAAIEAAFTKAVLKSCEQMDSEFRSVAVTSASHVQWRGRVADIYSSAERSVSLWTLGPDDVEGLLQPVRTHGDSLLRQLVRLHDCLSALLFIFVLW